MIDQINPAAVVNAALLLADQLDGIDGDAIFPYFTCNEIEHLIGLLVAVNRVDTAAHVLFAHSAADTTSDNDMHAEIGDAKRGQDNDALAYTDRDGYRLALAWVTP
ncbi:MAG: hypothetical protein ABWZ30_01055 [Jiangellaceae bacterium]